MSKNNVKAEIVIHTDSAEKDIKNLKNHLERVRDVADDIGGKTFVSGGDLDKLLSNVEKLLQDAGKVRSGIERDIDLAGSPKRKKELGKGLQDFTGLLSDMSTEMATAVKSLTKSSEQISRFKTPRSKSPGGPSWGERPFPEKVDLDTRQVQRDKQKVTSRVTSSVSGLQRAADSGQLSYKQAKVLEGNIREVYLGATGAKPENYDDVVRYAKGEMDEGPSWEVDDNTPMGRAQQGIKDTSFRIHELSDSLRGLRETINSTETKLDEFGNVVKGDDGKPVEAPVFPEGSEERNQQLLAIDKTREEISKQQKLREEHKNLLTEIVDGINRLEKARADYSDQTGSEDIRRAAEEGSIKHAIASRANAIALAVGTAAMFSVKSAISEGKSVVEGQREDSLRIGFSTGNHDFRGIRQEARSSGTHMGYTGDDMLGFGQSVMGSLGYTEETSGITAELARAEKFTGAQEGAMEQLFESMLRTGSVDSADEARMLTDAVTGGVIASGMVGREDEQIATLQAILDEQSAGRQMTNDEMKAQMAIISNLSGTGNKALQGENLKQNLGALQTNIAATDPFGMLGFHMGVGTDPYFTGEGGLFNFQKEVEKGLGSDMVISGLESVAASRGEGAVLDLISQMPQFAGVSTDAMEDIVSKLRAGELTAELGSEIQDQIAAGADKIGASESGYMDSSDSTHQEKDALKEARKANTADNAFVDAVASFERAVESFGAGSSTAAYAVTAISGAITGLATGALGAASLVGSPLLKNFGSTMQSVFGLGGVSEATAPIATGGMKGLASSGMATAGTAATNFLGGTAISLGAGNLAGGASLGAGGLAALGASTIAGGLIGGAGAFSGAKDIYQGFRMEKGKERQDKMFQGGTKIGMVGSGAAAGAAIGSVIPVVGTAAGGLIGAGIGGVGALLGGDGVGGWLSDKWGGTTQSENQKEIAQAQQDVSTTSSKASTENKRSDNVHQETRNLSSWDKLVEEIRVLLDVARRQNGIVGSASAAGAFSTGGTGVGGELGTVGKGGHWTSSNIRKHDITKTSSGLTSEQLDAWIADKASSDSKLIGMGSAFMEAGNKHGIDPRMLVGLAGHESGWGSSNFARNRNNFFGTNAQTNNPGRAFSYGSPEEGIMAGAGNVRRMFTDKGATNLDSMVDGSLGYKYADDPLWAQKMANTMKGSEDYVPESQGNVSINTTVNMSSSGKNKKDADEIAKEVGKKIGDRYLNPAIPSMYRQEMRRQTQW